MKNLTSDYICCDCGSFFLAEKQKVYESTFHVAKCGLCGEEKGVTHIRHFNYLK